MGGSVTGEIEQPYDEDWFSVELEAGKVYRFDLEPLPGAERTFSVHGGFDLPDIRDANGNAVAGSYKDYDSGDDDYFFIPGENGIYYGVTRDGASNPDTHLYFISPESGTYHVSAREFFGGFGSYSVSVREMDARVEDPIRSLAVGDSVTGSISHGDAPDRYRVTLDDDKTYRINLEGESTNQGTLWDPVLGVYDMYNSRFRLERQDDNGGVGTNSRLEFSPHFDGTYYIGYFPDESHDRLGRGAVVSVSTRPPAVTYSFCVFPYCSGLISTSDW